MSSVRAVFTLPAGVPAGAALGAVLAALVDIAASSVTTDFLSPVSRLMHAGWDLASFVVLGAAIDLLVYACSRIAGRRPLLGLALFAAISGWCVYALLADWLVHRAHHTLAGRHVELLLAATTCGMGLAPTACVIVGRQLSRWRATRVLATLVALAALVGNLRVLRDDYATLHVYGATLAFMLVGTALAPHVRLAPRKLAIAVLLLAALACLPPPNHVRVALTRSPGAVAAWLLATEYWRLPRFESAAEPKLTRELSAPGVAASATQQERTSLAELEPARSGASLPATPRLSAPGVAASATQQERTSLAELEPARSGAPLPATPPLSAPGVAASPTQERTSLAELEPARSGAPLPATPRLSAPGVAASPTQERTSLAELEPARSGAPSPLVVLLTIDAVRADLLAEARALQLPTLARLAREGAYFSQARAPGSQTAVTLTATFAGKHASELAWAAHGTGDFRHQYAAADATPRWPQWLSAHGVDTFKVISLAFLANAFGVAPGFAEERAVNRGKAHAPGTRVIEPLLERLRAAAASPQPCFVYAHLTEPHEPYDRGALKTGPAFERYVSEVALADTLLARVVELLESPQLAGRAVLVVTSDHGEAFGEHGTHEHSKTLYDELLRVPLVFWGKSIVPRTLTQPVSLIDLGPTLLELFGVQAQSDQAGESLMPLLAGRDVTLTRPIIAEGRLRRALVLGSRKIIVDERVHTLEAYDLARDPGELHNLYDTQPERFSGLLAALQAYFDARAYRAPGYERKFRQ